MNEKNNVTIGMTQFCCVESREANLAKAEAQIRRLAAEGAEIVCTQELFSDLYFAQIVDAGGYALAEPCGGPVNRRMRALAEELGIVLVSCYFEYAMDGVYYNSAAVFGADGALIGHYRKHHIPDGPQYHEKYYFTPGDGPYPVFRTERTGDVRRPHLLGRVVPGGEPHPVAEGGGLHLLPVGDWVGAGSPGA